MFLKYLYFCNSLWPYFYQHFPQQYFVKSDMEKFQIGTLQLTVNVDWRCKIYTFHKNQSSIWLADEVDFEINLEKIDRLSFKKFIQNVFWWNTLRFLSSSKVPVSLEVEVQSPPLTRNFDFIANKIAKDFSKNMCISSKSP